MQLLRDNLTLWTSSDGNDAEPAADAAKTEEKVEEPPAAPAPAEAETKPAEETAPAPAAA
jgi:14-3-3 protein epsilon